jgi:alpha-tubulin suppressor-like RCC1 family protein
MRRLATLATAVALAGCFAPEVRRFDEEPPDGSVGGTTLKATAIAMGTGNACAVLPDKTVRCWGPNRQGQLGVEPSVRFQAYRPVAVPNLRGMAQISVGYEAACALDTAGAASCWGASSVDGDGDDSMPYHPQPTSPIGLAPATALRLGARGGCAVTDSSELACWFDGNPGTVLAGVGPTPTVVPGFSAVTDVSHQDYSGCAVAGGYVWCWGHRIAGRLGDGLDETSVSLTPVMIPGVANAARVVAADRTTCAALTDGRVMCWGDGRLTGGGPNPDTCTASSSGPYPCQRTPAEVPGLTGVVELATGGSGICALRGDHSIACWGYDAGQLGTGTTGLVNTPLPMMVVDDATAIAMGGDTTCVIRGDQTVWCTGARTGYDATTMMPIASPVPVPLAQ